MLNGTCRKRKWFRNGAVVYHLEQTEEWEAVMSRLSFTSCCASVRMLILLPLCVFYLADACAATVTFNFEGVITAVDAPLAGRFAYGQKFSGRYTFDPDAPITGGSPEIGYAYFSDAISAMSFTSQSYSATAATGDIIHDFEDDKFYRARFIPVSGEPVGGYAANEMGVSWIVSIPGSFYTPIPHPNFDPDLPPYFIFANNELYDSGGNLVYDPVQDLIGDPNQPLFTRSGQPAPVNGNLFFRFASEDGEVATVSGHLTSVTEPNDYRVAHWLLDEGRGSAAHDVTGHGHDGTLVNRPSWHYDDRLYTNALSFDGVNDYVDVGAIDVAGKGLTLAAWVDPRKLENCRRNDCRIISKAVGTAENEHYWMLSTIRVGDKTRLRFRLKTDGVTSTLIATSGDLNNYSPFHAAAVYDGVFMRLYLNGVEVGRLSKHGEIDTNPAVDTWIGGNPGDPAARPWKGRIGDVRIYQRALLPFEIQAVKDSYALFDRSVKFYFEGKIDNVDAPLADAFAVGDQFTGSYAFDPNAPETGGATSYGFAQFEGAINAMQFDSRAYMAGARNGDIFQDYEDEDTYFNYIAPISGLPVGDYQPRSLGLLWIQSGGELSLDRPSADPLFDPRLPPFEINSNEDYFDADGKLVYGVIQGLVGDPDQPLFTADGRPAPRNGNIDFDFVNAAGGYATVTGGLTAVTKSMYLVAHWPLDEGRGNAAHDITSHGFDGRLVNRPTWIYDSARYMNQLVFDGRNDYVNVGAIDVPGKALTLAAWAESTKLNNCGYNDCRIISKATGTAEGDHYWMVSTVKVGNKTRLRFRLKTRGRTTTLIASSGDLQNGVPFHVAAVYDGMAMRLYKDGVEVGSRRKTGPVDTNSRVKAWIGGNPNDARSRPWKGIIADVKVFQKALSVSAIRDLIDSP